jgi:hypothetical protein
MSMPFASGFSQYTFAGNFKDGLYRGLSIFNQKTHFVKNKIFKKFKRDFYKKSQFFEN